MRPSWSWRVHQHADATVTAGMNYLFRVVHGKSGKRPFSALQGAGLISRDSVGSYQSTRSGDSFSLQTRMAVIDTAVRRSLFSKPAREAWFRLPGGCRALLRAVLAGSNARTQLKLCPRRQRTPDSEPCRLRRERNRPTVLSKCVRFNCSVLTTMRPDFGPTEGIQVQGSPFEFGRNTFVFNDESKNAQLGP